ncbi:MAG: glutathione S-transferase family protein [Rhodospirillaceae bacterium]
MVKLIEEDVQTKEVFDWKGVHLLHFRASSCSQKTRIFMNLKGIEWESHLIDRPKGENFTPWDRGINPRGLVPTLVIDGEVHIESNDIMTELDVRFPDRKLIPAGQESRVGELLHHEDELHLDLRTITFRYTQPRGKAPKSAESLSNYRDFGSGTVGGEWDSHKDREIDFWETAAREGLTDDAIRTSAARFRETLSENDQILSRQKYLMGDDLTVLDIAWFVYTFRLIRCGYPMERLHPHVFEWFTQLREMPEIASEIGVPPEVQKAVEENHRRQQEEGSTLVDVTGY